MRIYLYDLFLSINKVRTLTYIDQLKHCHSFIDVEKKKLGERIEARRLEIGLSQYQLAELIGVRVPTIYRYEAGKLMPSADSLDKISNALKTTSQWILRGEDLQGQGKAKKINPQFETWLMNEAPDRLNEKEQEILSSIDFHNMHPGPHIYSIILTMMRAAHPVQTAQVSRITNIKVG